MLRIVAVRTGDECTFTITCVGHPSLVTEEVSEASRCLREFGIENPDLLLEHARRWGTVEVAEAC